MAEDPEGKKRVCRKLQGAYCCMGQASFDLGKVSAD
jgi:hypothetical protein